jgi:hypothetical protein
MMLVSSENKTILSFLFIILGKSLIYTVKDVLSCGLPNLHSVSDVIHSKNHVIVV